MYTIQRKYLRCIVRFLFFFFFNDTATTEIYTLSLHDALPISDRKSKSSFPGPGTGENLDEDTRSEEHTSELQSRSDLVCRLLLETKKTETPRRTRRGGARRRRRSTQVPEVS